MPERLVGEVVDAARNLIMEALSALPTSVRFCCGWDGDKNELFCEIARDAIVKALLELAAFLDEAKLLKAGVYCQL
ncbi:hypothetical protein [Lysobacter antibioticus]|nr:hypothetical protein [Lysobacter antibioticus]